MLLRCSSSSRSLGIARPPQQLDRRRHFCRTGPPWAKKMPDRPPRVDEREFTEVFLKGSGPGGQKINKTSSAVQLRHIPTGIVLKVQETRSRAQNREIAREKLALQVELRQRGEQSRLAIVGAIKSKRKASAVKKSRRKYRLLEEQKEQNPTNQKKPTENKGS